MFCRSLPSLIVRCGALGAFVAFASLASCSKNTQAQRDTAKAAAEKYCECIKQTIKLPPAELAKVSGPLCGPEEKAYYAAWEALPDRANNDKEASAIYDYKRGCYNLGDDAREASRQTK